VDTSSVAGRANGSVYQAASGAWVFASGTMSWSWALGTPDFYDRRIERATQNVIDAIVSGQLPSPGVAAPPAATAYPRAVEADRPIAYWRLAGTTGWHTVDASGNLRDGLVSGQFSSVAGALSGDGDLALGSDGSASILAPVFPAVQDFTIEGWTFLPDSNWNAELNFNNTLYGANGHVRLLIRPGAPTPRETALGYFGVWLDGVEYALQPAHNGLDNTNQWVYWALTRQANVLTLYRNGTVIMQRNDLPPGAVANINGQLFALDSGWNLKGAMDDVAVYDTALSARRIEVHYAAARPPTR
jgi:hypothetical protein